MKMRIHIIDSYVYDNRKRSHSPILGMKTRVQIIDSYLISMIIGSVSAAPSLERRQEFTSLTAYTTVFYYTDYRTNTKTVLVNNKCK